MLNGYFTLVFWVFHKIKKKKTFSNVIFKFPENRVEKVLPLQPTMREKQNCCSIQKFLKTQ